MTLSIRTDIPLPGHITLCSQLHRAVGKLTLCSCPTGFVWTSCTPNLSSVRYGPPTNAYRQYTLAIFQFAKCFGLTISRSTCRLHRLNTVNDNFKTSQISNSSVSQRLKRQSKKRAIFQLILPQSQKLRPEAASEPSLLKKKHRKHTCLAAVRDARNVRKIMISALIPSSELLCPVDVEACPERE